MVDEATLAASRSVWLLSSSGRLRSGGGRHDPSLRDLQQYAAGSKQTKSASVEISALAAAMQDSISTFNVTQDDQPVESEPTADLPIS